MSPSGKDFGRKELEYLRDIEEAICEIEEHPRFADGKSGWQEDKYYRGWCYLHLARIGEAANYLCKPEYGNYQEKDPDTPWRKIKGMRTILVHIYWNLDDQVGWTALEQLPELKAKVQRWIEAREKDEAAAETHEPQANKFDQLLNEAKLKDQESDK